MPVRVAKPKGMSGLKEYVDDSTYSTVVGLLHYGMQANEQQSTEANKSEGIASITSRILAWFKGEF
jgi:cell division protein FtsA